MNYKSLDYLLGGDLVLSENSEDNFSESIYNIYANLQSLDEQEEIKEELDKIEELFKSISEKLSLDESAIAAAFIVPLLSSVGITAIGIALNRYMNGDSVVPTPILNVLNKLANWVERGDKVERRKAIETAIIKSGKLSPKDAKRISEAADKAKIEAMKKKFPRMATK